MQHWDAYYGTTRCSFRKYTASRYDLASFPRRRESRWQALRGLDARLRGHDVLRAMVLVLDLRNRHLGSWISNVDPQGMMGRFVSWEIAQQANNWAGRNIMRWANAEYDRLWREAELDPVRPAALFMRMNDLVIEDVMVIPVVWRHGVSAVSHSLRGMQLGPWDLAPWDLAYWYREE